MKEVCIVILVAFVIGGFTFPADFDPEYAWVYSGKFEGDIVLQPDQEAKHGRTDPKYRWPNGVLYYQFHSSLTQKEKDVIMGAIGEYHTRTCLRIEPRTNQQNYVEFVKRDNNNCFSEVGMVGQRQELNLGVAVGCFYHGTIVHELMHAFGYWHQHADPKRDNYVTIMWDNIKPFYRRQFQKYNSDIATDFGVGYDYGSIMHYPRNAFSANGRNTIEAKEPNVEIGQQRGLSPKDIAKLHKMYKKPAKC